MLSFFQRRPTFEVLESRLQLSADFQLIKDINSIGTPAGSSAREFVNVGGTLFFQANDGVSGYELWKSNGADGGTVRVKDIRTGSGDSRPSDFVDLNGTVYFFANDGASGHELWKSDGTSASTIRVKDIRPGPLSSQASHLARLADAIYFIADDGVSGDELWRSDGTKAGTVLVKDIEPGITGSSVRYLTEMGGSLYFRALGSLWKTDGTAALRANMTETLAPLLITVEGQEGISHGNDSE